MALPNFFIVGAQKSGTTSLFSLLAKHPDIYLSPIKEPNYFCTDLHALVAEEHNARIAFNPNKYFSQRPLQELHYAHIIHRQDYEQLFEEGRGKLCGESSTNYLYSTVAAKEIKKEVPNAKIIILLREPVARAYSHYWMDFGDGEDLPPFAEALQLRNAWLKDDEHQPNLWVDFGYYLPQVRRYLKVFGHEQVFIGLLEDLQNNPKTLLNDIQRFLGVKNIRLEAASKNEATVPRNVCIRFLLRRRRLRRLVVKLLPKALKAYLIKLFFTKKPRDGITPEARQTLAATYNPMIRKLERVIKRDLSHWKYQE